jgi:hypothetical protein
MKRPLQPQVFTHATSPQRNRIEDLRRQQTTRLTRHSQFPIHREKRICSEQGVMVDARVS